MTPKLGKDIGKEVHRDINQSSARRSGTREVSINGKVYEIEPGTAVTVPGGAHHNLNLWGQAGADNVLRRAVWGHPPDQST
jgi:mannose-6-phosphate isomerase-like protein (cupin superfamily)